VKKTVSKTTRKTTPRKPKVEAPVQSTEPT
jgi:hypothetical protein